MPARPALHAGLLLRAVLVLAGCNSDAMLPVAPNVLQDGSGGAQLRQLPVEQHTPDMQIMYVTDRAEEAKGKGGIRYGFDRSRHTSYGVAAVSLGKPVRWNDLVAYSGEKSNAPKYAMKITSVVEQGRYAPTLTRMDVRDGKLVLVDREGEEQEIRQAQAVLAEALSKTEHKDVYIFASVRIGPRIAVTSTMTSTLLRTLGSIKRCPLASTAW
jgi:hypothetical protein